MVPTSTPDRFGHRLTPLTAQLALILLVAPSPSLPARAEPPSCKLYEPHQWHFRNPSYKANPFDLLAYAVFTHRSTGKKIRTELFYQPPETWILRFTPTLPGRWDFVTYSDDPDLSGHHGTIQAQPNPGNPGFLTKHKSKWLWQGTDRAFVPQYVMYANPDVLYDNPDRIDADITEFLDGHGFNGFHIWIACRWFDLRKTRSNEISSDDPNPDPRTFEILELLIRKTHAAGGVVHIWAWGDEQRKMTPKRWGLNGRVDQRLQRYICARLGPLPGWSMGYGWDLQEWVTRQDLQRWHQFMHAKLGWHHFLGGRSPRLTQICPTLDYSSYQQHRPDYAIYRKAIDQYPDKPTFFEDRFRVRKNVYPEKDYDFTMTRRGLWHSTLAGGAANIWGNLLSPRPDGASHPYPNKHQIKTWARFWQDRFKKDMVPDNRLTDGLCIKSPRTLLVFYKEDTSTIRMDLSELSGPIHAVAVDTTRPYAEQSLSLEPAPNQLFTAPYKSDWAVAAHKTPPR